eukprot:74452_1
MKINIKTLSQESLTVTVNPTDTVYDIKLQIQSKWNYTPSNQTLIFAGKSLKDQDKMSDEKYIVEGSVINLILKQPPKLSSNSTPIKVTVKTLSSQSLSLIVNPTDTAYDMKVKIKNALNYEPKHQILIYAGKRFKDDQLFMQNSNPPMKDGSVIHLIMKSGHFPPKKVSKFSPCNAYKSGQIFVKTLTGKTITLNVKSSDKIEIIKRKIQQKEGASPEIQRLLFKGQNLCPLGDLQTYGIHTEATIHLVLKLGSGATPTDSMLHGVYFESFGWWNLHELIPVKNFDTNVTKLIWEYSKFIHLNAMKVHSKCMAQVGRSERVMGICQFCNGYKWAKPYIDHDVINSIFSELGVDSKNPKYDGFYGLLFTLQFKTYRSNYNQSWTIELDIDSINDGNIDKYIEIKESTNQIPLAFRICDIGKMLGVVQFITIGIDENVLRKDKMQKLFEFGRLKVDIIVHEEPMPVIYGGRLSDKGPIIGDVKFEHNIYRV